MNETYSNNFRSFPYRKQDHKIEYILFLHFDLPDRYIVKLLLKIISCIQFVVIAKYVADLGIYSRMMSLLCNE